MLPKECPFGFWKIIFESDHILEVRFKTPSLRWQRFNRFGWTAFKVAYITMMVGVSYAAGPGAVLLFPLLLLPLGLASMLRRGPSGDERFIPYEVRIDRKQQSIEMIDPREHRLEARTFAYKEVRSIAVHYEPAIRLAFTLRNGERIILPAPGWEYGALLDHFNRLMPPCLSLSVSAR